MSQMVEPAWEARQGTPTLKLSHVGPHPRAGPKAPDNFLPRCAGIFCSCGAIRAAQGPGLGACAADICTRGAPRTPDQQHFREGSSIVLLDLLGYKQQHFTSERQRSPTGSGATADLNLPDTLLLDWLSLKGKHNWK